jgi:hypothetical protein
MGSGMDRSAPAFGLRQSSGAFQFGLATLNPSWHPAPMPERRPPWPHAPGHQNPVKHGLVPVANQYPWCSAAWFERTAPAAMVKSIYRFKVDQVRVRDDFEAAPEW